MPKEQISQTVFQGSLKYSVQREVGGCSGRWGTHVYLWLIHVDVWQKPSQYCSYSPIKIK